jgi:Phage integrase family
MVGPRLLTTRFYFCFDSFDDVPSLAGIVETRHTFASRLVNRGVDIVTVQQLLGYSAITVTMRYTHTNLDSKHAAVARLDDFSDSLVTVCTKMQQTKERLSLNGALSYNVSAG